LRELERDHAAAGDAATRLALARAWARSGREADALGLIEAALRDDPLSADALALEHELGASPLASASPWPTIAGGNDRARRSAMRGPREGRVDARLRVGAAPMQRANGDVERPLSITVGGDGAVYVATDQLRLIALDLATREPRWIREFERPFAAPSVGTGERLALASGGSVRLIHGRTGETLWIAQSGLVTQTPVPAAATFAPGGLVLAPGLLGALYAFDAASGKIRWKAATHGAQYATPAVSHRAVYHACALGGVYVFDLEGRLKAETRVSACHGPTGAVLAREDLLLVERTNQSKLYAIRIHADRLEPTTILPEGLGEARPTASPTLIAASRTHAAVDMRGNLSFLPLPGATRGAVSFAGGRPLAAAFDADGYALVRTLESVDILGPEDLSEQERARVPSGSAPVDAWSWSVVIGPGSTAFATSAGGFLYIIR
jgi:outer membrane protein assembly factor BamB